MKKLLVFALIACCVVSFGLTSAAVAKKGPKLPSIGNPVSRLTHAGDITGIINDGTAVVEGALVYIPGTSFMAKTDKDGIFRIYNVPAGTYDLAVEIPNCTLITTNSIGDPLSATVYQKSLTDLKLITVTCVTPPPAI